MYYFFERLGSQVFVGEIQGRSPPQRSGVEAGVLCASVRRLNHQELLERLDYGDVSGAAYAHMLALSSLRKALIRHSVLSCER